MTQLKHSPPCFVSRSIIAFLTRKSNNNYDREFSTQVSSATIQLQDLLWNVSMRKHHVIVMFMLFQKTMNSFLRNRREVRSWAHKLSRIGNNEMIHYFLSLWIQSHVQRPLFIYCRLNKWKRSINITIINPACPATICLFTRSRPR